MHTRLHLIAYDIANPKRWRGVVKAMETAGTRVQKSIFEAALNFDERQALITRVTALVDKNEDKYYIQPLCAHCARRIRWQGLPRTEAAKNYWII
jgi:CRISPR-associated protein Cas2